MELVLVLSAAVLVLDSECAEYDHLPSDKVRVRARARDQVPSFWVEQRAMMGIQSRRWTGDQQPRSGPTRLIRVGVAGCLVALPMVFGVLFYQQGNPVIDGAIDWSLWCVVAWTAMQGPGRWKAALAGLGYGLLLALVWLFLWRMFQPYQAGPWSTFWNIDFPPTAFAIVKSWALFRILSMITGLEISDPRLPLRPRWGLRRWFLFMMVLAIFLQASVVEMNWLAELSKELASTSWVGPMEVSPLTESRRIWLVYSMAVMLAIPCVPILLAAWMLAGKPWRWALFPFFGVVVVAMNAAAYLAIETARTQTTWMKSVISSLQKDWALYGIAEWFAYCFAAILIPWMGYRWTDYWSTSRPPESSNLSHELSQTHERTIP